MTAQELALLIADLLEDHIEDGLNAATLDSKLGGEIRRFTPSILSRRAFLGLVGPTNQQFLITIEEA